ncbi:MULTISPECIES: segregation/condensation protein A [Aerococcus]|uniref:Segregation and condensation protein A n=1 Tax=Aerococcus sanguinicola TaxID=119206 RepID=A0A5N1GL28_9LACT|nr:MULTISPECIES: segregation/condensation protein A [Aerococcus]KAA9300919.1 segregation and condensation protein A [Aerococcus sanguinicola]MDK6369152.1 segregation/condensation protein A [Aerococcus sp. UMB9870]MDK6679788.1 segregation/condensation protein A [Aerococcus sp. UMB8608]MDK6686645.1 segregation/condensation protein A [Aerococcus sp. UMB8623]MDK6939710.1 segregation/condensation protein A [Aerococcus sp. UMB8487]
MEEKKQLEAYPASALRLDLASFEGPLDLLLHLIKTLEVDIFDIPIVLVTEQYLAYLEDMKELELDLASEYLVMAASLIEIKSKMMLPQAKEEAEEEEDPRDDLVQQLLTYQQYQNISQLLEEKQEARQLEYPKAASDLSQWQVKLPLPEGAFDQEDLLAALRKMMRRLKNQAPLERQVQAETYTVQEAMDDLLSACPEGRVVSFYQIILEGPLSRERIVTLFLAVLQLVKRAEISFAQRPGQADIEIRRNEVG